MYWVIKLGEGAASTTVLQTVSAGQWVVVVGLCVLLTGSGVLAWRRNRSGEPPSTSDEPPSNPEPAVLTDEERVLGLLESHGGRMRQTAIVEETGWSKSKVSVLLSEMESNGSISKLRVGRENLISRSGFEPEAARSTLETGP